MTYKIVSASFSFKRLHNELNITLEEELNRFLEAGDFENLLQVSLPIERVVLQSLGSRGVKLDAVIEAYGRELERISPAKKDKVNAVLKELMPHIPFDISKTTNVEVVDAFSQKLNRILEVFSYKEGAMGPDDFDTVEGAFQRNQGAWVSNIILDAIYENLDSDDHDLFSLFCSDRAFIDVLLDRDDEFFSYILDFLSDELRHDVELAKKALPKGYSHFFSNEVMQAIYDEQTARERLEESGLCLFEQLPDELRNKLSDDAELITGAVRKNGFDIEYASERLRDDFDIAKLALMEVFQRGDAPQHSPYRYFSDRLKRDEQLLYEAARYGVQFVKDIPADTLEQISRDDTFLRVLFSRKLSKDRIQSFEHNSISNLTSPCCAGSGYCEGFEDDVMRVLSDNLAAIELLPEAIRNSSSFLIAAAAMARHVPESFYDAIPWDRLNNDVSTRDVLEKLVKAHSDAYVRLSKEFKQDRRVLAALAESHPDRVFHLIPEEVMEESFSVINMLEKSERLFLYLPEKLSSDRTCMAIASRYCERNRAIAFDFIEHQAKIITHLAEEFRENKETVLEALSRNTRVIHYISNELKHDTDIIRAAREDGLFICSESGAADIVRELVSSGVSPNAADDNGLPCLHAAVQNRWLDITRFLLENGADVNGLDRYDRTAICKAYCNDDFDMVALLREFNPEMTVTSIAFRFDMTTLLPFLSPKRSESEAAAQLLQESDYRGLMGANFLGQEEWRQAFGLEFNSVPPIPESFSQEFLLQPCPLTGAPHIKDTHILFFMPLGLSLEKLTSLLAKSTVQDAKVDLDLDLDMLNILPFGLESKWRLVPKSLYAAALGESYQAQLQIKESIGGYSVAGFGVMLTLFFLNYLSNGEKLFEHQIARCNEILRFADGSVVIQVGPFKPFVSSNQIFGLRFSEGDFSPCENVGLALISER